MATILTETWTGTTGAAWPVGWTTRRGTTTIQANEGRLTAPAGAYATGRVDNTGMVVTGDTDLTTEVYGGAAAVEQYTYLFIDSDNGTATGNWEADNCYYLVLQYDAVAASSKVIIGQSVAGTVTALQNVTKSLTGTSRYKVRFQRSAQQLRARAWLSTDAEPTVWDAEVTLAGTPLTGRVGLLAANGAATTARLFNFDNLAVSDMQSAAVAGNVTGKVATGTTSSAAPGVSGAAVVSGKVSSGSSSAPSPTVAAVIAATVGSVRAIGSGAAPAPTVSGVVAANVTAARATAAGAALTSTVMAGANVQAVTTAGTANSPLSVITAGASIQSVQVSATAAALPATPTAGAEIAHQVASATASAALASVSTGANIQAATAAATATTYEPLVFTGTAAWVEATTATGTATAGQPTVFGARAATIVAAPARATGRAYQTTLFAALAATITVAPATATGRAYPVRIRLVDLRDLTLTIAGLAQHRATTALPTRYDTTAPALSRTATPTPQTRDTKPMTERLEVQPA